jgi:hypothetical protein
MINEEFKIVNVMGGHEEAVDALTGGAPGGDGTPGDGTPGAGSSVDGSNPDDHYDYSSDGELQTNGNGDSVANALPAPVGATPPAEAVGEDPAPPAPADDNTNESETDDDASSACGSANTMTTASLIANGCLYTILEQMLTTPVKGEEEDAPKRNMAYILNEIRVGIEKHTEVQQRIADTLVRIADALPAAGTESEEESS